MMTSSRSAQLQSLQALTEMQEFLDFISNEGRIFYYSRTFDCIILILLSLDLIS